LVAVFEEFAVVTPLASVLLVAVADSVAALLPRSSTTVVLVESV
jgi:hypothetical protein